MKAVTIADVERSGAPDRFTLPYIAGNSVVSGCEVSPAEQNSYNLDITDGVVSVHGREVTVAAHNVNLQPPVNGELRLDLVAVDKDGHVVIVRGPNGERYPALPAAHVALAAVLLQGVQPPLPNVRPDDISDLR